MELQRSRWRRRVADSMGVLAVVVAAWAPLAVVLDAPLALAAAFGGIALSTSAGSVDDANRCAPTAFLVALGIDLVALVLYAVRS